MPNDVVIITQARMTSTRLPGKILMRAGERTLLETHLDRLASVGVPVIVATTTNLSDGPVVELCAALDIPIFRGSEDDVLERYQGAARAHEARHVIRVTSDCPLICPDVIRAGLDVYSGLKSETVYLSNGEKRTYPRGMDFEIFSRRSLDFAAENARLPSEREHVTGYIRTSMPDIRHEHCTDEEDLSDWRITVDTDDDFKLVKRLIEDHHASEMDYPGLKALLKAHPDLMKINSHIQQKLI